jgi:hypothetical protein
VDSHLKGVPGLGTLTTGGLAGGDLEGLGWETDWTLDGETLGLGALNELGADLLEGSDLAGGEGDTDLVGFLQKNFTSATMSFKPKHFLCWQRQLH